MNQETIDYLVKKYNIKTPVDELQQLIQNKGLTNDQANTLLELPPNTIDKIITGEILLTEDYVIKLQKCLDLSDKHFIDFTKIYLKQLFRAIDKEWEDKTN